MKRSTERADERRDPPARKQLGAPRSALAGGRGAALGRDGGPGGIPPVRRRAPRKGSAALVPEPGGWHRGPAIPRGAAGPREAAGAGGGAPGRRPLGAETPGRGHRPLRGDRGIPPPPGHPAPRNGGEEVLPPSGGGGGAGRGRAARRPDGFET